jgi:probable HAF family extracellular repeat protein
MKKGIRGAMVAVTLFTTVTITFALGVSAQQADMTTSRYSIRELPTLGGTVGAADSINDSGWVAGYSNVSGNRTEHGFLWIDGKITDLGTLGGPNSSVGFPVKNAEGILVGFSQTASADPLHEGWNYSCTVSGHLCQGKNLITLGFVWQNGSMKPLPPFSGGNISEAFGANNSGQIVGIAETGYADPTCMRPQVLDYIAVIWGPDSSMQALNPYGNDQISAAVAINSNGQVVGGSGPCAPLSPSIGAHAVLWQSGSSTATDLGSLGGTTNNVAFGINGEGQIVGISGLVGNTAARAFLWQDGGPMQDLGTLPGDVLSIAYSINDTGQVVGQSCDPTGNCRAVVWQDGVGMTDLNALTGSGTVRLIAAFDINNQGQIVGQAYDQDSGNYTPFLAIPQ